MAEPPPNDQVIVRLNGSCDQEANDTTWYFTASVSLLDGDVLAILACQFKLRAASSFIIIFVREPYWRIHFPRLDARENHRALRPQLQVLLFEGVTLNNAPSDYRANGLRTLISPLVRCIVRCTVRTITGLRSCSILRIHVWQPFYLAKIQVVAVRDQKPHTRTS